VVDRTLFLKEDSKVLDYLMEIGEDAEIELELGEYPGIEELAYAVLEMKSRGRGSGVTLEQVRAWSEKYTKGAFRHIQRLQKVV